MKSRAFFAFLASTIILAMPVRAEDIRAFFYGNSLVNHVSGSDETTVPHWLALLAEAGGHGFAADGVFADAMTAPDALPPEPNWSFAQVPSAIAQGGGAFRRAGFNAVILNTRNYVQDVPPSDPFSWQNPRGYSAISGTAHVFEWSAVHAPGARFFLYEGWADMGPFLRSFPPNARRFARYQRANRGAYHDWYEAYQRGLRARLPDLDITLIPVAPILADLFTSAPLDTLAPTDLYSDDAPHGTASTYFLAALITYAALYQERPPAFTPPSSIHPTIAEHYEALSARIWTAVSGVDLVAPRGVHSDTGLADPALAMGLNGLSDWTTQLPFLNLMKTARPWTGHLPGQWGGVEAQSLRDGGYLDEEGWPLALPPGLDAIESLILTDLPADATGTVGRYRVTWAGEGVLTVTGRADLVDAWNHEIWFNYSPGDGAVGVRISALDPDDPIRDIVVLREEHIALYELGERFNPDWIAHIRDLRAVRFMDWMDTNGSEQSTWQDRPRESDYTYTRRGVPLEVMLDLVNHIGADPWFTLPHQADDAYIRAFATQVEAGLSPDLKVYAEFSNELWNQIFEQAEWATREAQAAWGADAEGDAWMQFAGQRAAQVADIWAEVFAGQDHRLTRVIATQTSWPGLEEPLLTAPLSVAAGARPPYESFDAYAITGYFGHELGTGAYVDDVLALADLPARNARLAQMLRAGEFGTLIDSQFPYHAGVAHDYGLELVMYEGGTHVVGLGAAVENDTLTAIFTEFNYSPEMAGLYSELLQGWRAVGGTLFNGFVDVAAPSRWGSWGALRHLADVNPRWQTLVAYNALGAGWEARAPGAFAHGAYIWGDAGDDELRGTAQGDVFIAAEGDDRLFLGPGDRAHGGAGRDEAYVPGQRAEYALRQEGAAWVLDGPEGEIRLVAVEFLGFEEAPGQLVPLEAE